jgi:hypothetical protein
MLSKDYDKNFRENHPKILSFKDYVGDRVLIAKLLFGKEKVNLDFLITAILRKILYGNSEYNNKDKRPLSLIINGYYKDDTDFKKHQRFIDFLANNLHVCDSINLGGEAMNYESLEDLVNWKFNQVTLMQNNSQAKEFYVLGLLAATVISFQKMKNSDREFKSSLENFLNSIGMVTNQNKDRVFNKIVEGAKKYDLFGREWDYLLGLYSDIRSESTEKKYPMDRANILFVMGNIDLRKFKFNKKEASNV